MFKGKKLLITGGTGSFGNAVLDRFINSDIAEIRIFSRDERKQDDMRTRYGSNKLNFYIGDVRDYRSIESAMTGVDFVFSAAALKQVPSCEFFPVEAVRTNVLGTENTLRAAKCCGVSKVIVLSTDKAVYPVNAMGMSKALMEKVVVANSRNRDASDTVLCTTRYGNVMGSSGSVIPRFIDQILNGQEITVTDPTMTRFMMSLYEAVELVVFAFQHGDPGDILVQKAPAATVETLAQALKNIFNSSVNIRMIGTRHGEKKHETLLSREEMTKAEDLGNFYRVRMDKRELNYGNYLDTGQLSLTRQVEYTSENTERLDIKAMEKTLLELDFVQAALNNKIQLTTAA